VFQTSTAVAVRIMLEALDAQVSTVASSAKWPFPHSGGNLCGAEIAKYQIFRNTYESTLLV